MLRAIVIGGGPAGLATSYELKKRGIEHVVLERGDVASSWSSRVYDSLTLHTGKLMSSLPGRKFDRSTPKFLSRAHFLEYLRAYSAGMPIRRGEVTSMLRDGDAWIVNAGGESLRAQCVVVATGIMSNPFEPSIAGREVFKGTIRHSSQYRNAASFAGKRVLVVGCGNSGGEIASELGSAGVDTTIAIRSGANVVPLHLAGIPIQYIAYGARPLPKFMQRPLIAAIRILGELRHGPQRFPRSAHSPLDVIPIIGFHLVDAIRAGKVRVRGGIKSLTDRGAVFDNGAEETFDEIILATGFRPAISFVNVTTDSRGFALRRDRVASAEHPNLYFVGHNYDSTGALFNIGKDARLVAESIARAQ